MKKLFFIFAWSLLLIGCKNSNTTSEITANKKDSIIKKDTISKKDTVVVATPDTDINPLSLLKGELLSDLLAGEMTGMTLGREGKKSILHTMYDVDSDGDKDLLMQVFFQKEKEIQDAFIIYYNNEKPEVDPDFQPGFSAEDYHKLGQDGGDPRPCENCILEKNEKNIFTFTDRETGKNFLYKLIHEKGIGLKWEKLEK